MRQLVLDILRERPARFEDFVVGANGALLAALHEAAVAGGEPVYVWGEAGSGKSHLLQSAVALALERERPACAMGGPALADGAGTADALIAIDDVDQLDARSQVALFNAYNRRAASGQTILAAGRCAPRELPLRDDLRSRIAQGLIFQLQPLAEPERRRILQTLAERRSLRLDDEVLSFLLRHGRRDLPSLIRVLDALDAASLQQQRPITLPLLRSLVQAGLPLD